MIQKGRCSHWSSLQAEAAALEAQKRAVCCHFWLRTCWVGCVQSSGFHLQQERRPERGGAASRWLMVPLPPDPSAAGIWFGRATVCPWPSWWDSPALGSGFDCSCWGRALPGIEEGCRIAGAAGGGGAAREGAEPLEGVSLGRKAARHVTFSVWLEESQEQSLTSLYAPAAALWPGFPSWGPCCRLAGPYVPWWAFPAGVC